MCSKIGSHTVVVFLPTLMAPKCDCQPGCRGHGQLELKVRFWQLNNNKYSIVFASIIRVLAPSQSSDILLSFRKEVLGLYMNSK